ncbi:mucin-2-like [Polyodon spathula]|uniref:mucin-2-like n=1 Tax=Polyodon spathula TaxID=7913 RepID=UPI001B7DD2D8|nr:mucin-2-like [Polyodon spathula]
MEREKNKMTKVWLAALLAASVCLAAEPSRGNTDSPSTTEFSYSNSWTGPEVYTEHQEFNQPSLKPVTVDETVSPTAEAPGAPKTSNPLKEKHPAESQIGFHTSDAPKSKAKEASTTGTEIKVTVTTALEEITARGRTTAESTNATTDESQAQNTSEDDIAMGRKFKEPPVETITPTHTLIANSTPTATPGPPTPPIPTLTPTATSTPDPSPVPVPAPARTPVPSPDPTPAPAHTPGPTPGPVPPPVPSPDPTPAPAHTPGPVPPPVPSPDPKAITTAATKTRASTGATTPLAPRKGSWLWIGGAMLIILGVGCCLFLGMWVNARRKMRSETLNGSSQWVKSKGSKSKAGDTWAGPVPAKDDLAAIEIHDMDAVKEMDASNGRASLTTFSAQSASGDGKAEETKSVTQPLLEDAPKENGIPAVVAEVSSPPQANGHPGGSEDDGVFPPLEASFCLTSSV